MIRSQPLLPIRFYDDLFEQDRFNKFFQITHTNLYHPVSELPHFQITRNRSLNEPTKFILRNICSDIYSNYYKVVPEGVFANNQSFLNFFSSFPEAGFIFDDGVHPPSGTVKPIAEINCGKLVNTTLGGFYTYSSGVGVIELPIELSRYDVKINVDKLVRSFGSTFKLDVYLGDNTGLLLDSITKSGSYTYNINNPTESKISIYFDNYVVDNDLFEISDLQAVIYATDKASYITDVNLDVNSLSVFDSEESGIISYCQPSVNLELNPGEYYYIVECNQEVYYSEIFCLKSLKEIEKFYKITWWNNCDFKNSIIYDPDKLMCDFRNIVYLDAALFKPEYNTSNETISDGENTLISTFKKWQKSLNLEIVNANEYLADCLSGIFIHDNAFIKEPLNKGQVIQNEEFEITEVTPSVESIFEDAFQKVTLKFLLSKFYVKSGCCDDFEEFNCNRCDYSAAVSALDADYFLVISSPADPGDGLFKHSDSSLVAVKSTDIICDVDNNKYYRLGLIGSQYFVELDAIKIDSVGVFPGYWAANFMILPNTFAELEYNIDGAGWVTGESAISDINGFGSVNFNSSLAIGHTDVKFRINNKTIFCNYGTSPIYDAL